MRNTYPAWIVTIKCVSETTPRVTMVLLWWQYALPVYFTERPVTLNYQIKDTHTVFEKSANSLFRWYHFGNILFGFRLLFCRFINLYQIGALYSCDAIAQARWITVCNLLRAVFGHATQYLFECHTGAPLNQISFRLKITSKQHVKTVRRR